MNKHRKRDLLARALKIVEAQYGPDHVEVAKALTNLACAHGDLGDATRKRAKMAVTSGHRTKMMN